MFESISQQEERRLVRRRYEDGSVLAEMMVGRGREVFGFP